MMIRRDNLFEDGFEAFKQVKMINLKAKLCVIYIDEFGNTEEGIGILYMNYKLYRCRRYF